ncbi:hypothetical protein AMS68_004275 [Peltaster fructicola]|uniref:Uncharacterized protein n=1 Tax=Peltaster fructicola TaxID=286661 RepID=A0A6H0XVY1_9PEZI|nr:hypothetical protein AMS68_004275 [Peltaster fructicola]
MQTFINLLTLAIGASALAVPETVEKRAGVQYEDNFDDLATTIAAPQLFPVGAYNGLSYGGAVVLRPIPGVASVLPHSPSQQAGAAGPLDLLYLGQLTLNTYATLTPASGTKTFDLQSFWWGFGTDTATTAGLAQGGTLYVVGYDVNNNQTSTSYAFAPKSAINEPLIFAQLPAGFTNLKNATFAVATSEPLTERTYIALDNVRHINYS